VKLELRILGLGVKNLFWFQFCRQAALRLLRYSIGVEFRLIKRKGADTVERNLAAMADFKPDIIVTSMAVFENLGMLEKLILNPAIARLGSPPAVFLIADNVSATLEQFFIPIPSVHYYLKGFGKINIPDVDFIEFNHETPYRSAVIQPAPILEQEGGAPLHATHDRIGVFLPLTKVVTVHWNETRYEPSAFIRQWFTEQPSTQQPIKGFLLQPGQIQLSGGLSLSELLRIDTGRCWIHHLIGYRQVKAKSTAAEVFWLKLLEQSKRRALAGLEVHLTDNPAVIKSNLPLSIGCENLVFADIFQRILECNGYRLVTTSDRAVGSTPRLHLQLTESEIGNESTELTLPITFNKIIFDIPGLPKVKQEMIRQMTIDTEKQAIDAIRQERGQIIKKIDRIDSQIKNLSSSKILADQERYMNLLASRKLEIVNALMEMASTWNEHHDQVIRTFEEDVLIFHDGEMQASLINNSLEGDGRRLFVDVIEYCEDMRSFVTLNTDHCEPFLHEGMILISHSARSVLIQTLHQFQQELANKKYPEINKGIDRLQHEKRHNLQRMIQLAAQEVWQMLLQTYQENAAKLFQTARQAKPTIDAQRMTIVQAETICLLAPAREAVNRLRSALQPWLSAARRPEIHAVCEPLPSALAEPDAEPDEKVMIHALSDYLDRILLQLSLIATDLLIIEHDLPLLGLLAKILRQPTSRYRLTPIVAVFTDHLQTAVIEDLIIAGVKPVYRFNGDTDDGLDLTDQLGQALC
jgi:hypothetical protein